MASRKKSSPTMAVGSPELSPAQSIPLLKKHYEAGEKLLTQQPVKANDYSTWTMLARNYLEKAFGKVSPNVAAVIDVGRYGSFPMGASQSWWDQHRAKSLETQLAKLDGLIDLLATEIDLEEQNVIAPPVSRSGHRIFLVHGHDERALHETARFLEKLHQDVVVLREQPNRGRTIVEKFEDYSDVGFAVVLLTADDMGGPVLATSDNFHKRARQNVIFELGYFNGRLGRNRTCALYQSGVEIPSDYAGVLYIELDEKGAWRLQLARELSAAGFSIDMNDAL